MNGNVIRTITIRGTSEGLDKVTADLNKLASAQTNVAVVSEQSAKRVLSLEDAWKRQTLKLDEAARAQANIARETKLADAALREGVATQAQHAQRLDQINQRYNTASQSTQQFATQTGLARHELINLSRQAQDVGVQLVSGQSPLMILAQQGSQIADVFISSGKSVGSFFTQAIGWGKVFLTSTVGIVTGIAAVGAAAAYAAVQFLKASTTIEQALENENRLLKEGKALIDARTSAEARAQLNPKDLTEYEIKRNLLDVQRKLNEEAKNALIRTAPRPNIAGDIRGEFAGEAPLTPGMDKVLDATVKLKEAQAAGLPGMKEYNAELARIATAHPELAKTVDKMIELGRTGIELENAEMRLRAISDAAKGVATDAQMAAVGFGSLAQKQLSDRQAKETAAATERQAKATLQMAAAYPGMSIEGAKLADSASKQLQMAQAVGQMAQIEVAHRQRLAELTDKLGASEATRIAGAERAVQLAQIEAQHRQTMKDLSGQLGVAEAVGGIAKINAQYDATVDSLKSQIGLSKALEQAEAQRAIAIAQIESAHRETMIQLQGQLKVAQQVTGIAQINAQYDATVANLTIQIGLERAIEQAEMGRKTAIAQVNAEADRTLKQLQQEGELIRATTEDEKDRIKARQTYQNLVDKGVKAEIAQAVARQQLRNAEEQSNKQQIAAQEQGIANIKTSTDAWKLYEQGIVSWSVANDEAGNATRRMAKATEDASYWADKLASSMFSAGQAALIANSKFVPFATTWASMGPTSLGTGAGPQGPQGLTQFDPAGYTSTINRTGGMDAATPGAGQFITNYMGGPPTTPETFTKLTNQHIDAITNAGLTSGRGYSQIIDQLLAPVSELASFNPGSVQATAQLLGRMTALLPEQEQIEPIQKQIDLLQQQPHTLARDELIKQLTDQLKQLTDASKENTDALKTQADPLFSQGHEYLNQLRIGYYKAAEGGIFGPGGPMSLMPINRYAGGGVASSPQMAMFGEAGPEAFIPLKGGAVPVTIKTGGASNDNSKNITQNITQNITINTTPADRLTGRQRAQGFITAATNAAAAA